MFNAVGRAASTLYRVAPKAQSTFSKTLPAIQTVSKLDFVFVLEEDFHLYQPCLTWPYTFCHELLILVFDWLFILRLWPRLGIRGSRLKSDIFIVKYHSVSNFNSLSCKFSIETPHFLSVSMLFFVKIKNLSFLYSFWVCHYIDFFQLISICVQCHCVSNKVELSYFNKVYHRTCFVSLVNTLQSWPTFCKVQ